MCVTHATMIAVLRSLLSLVRHWGFPLASFCASTGHQHALSAAICVQCVPDKGCNVKELQLGSRTFDALVRKTVKCSIACYGTNSSARLLKLLMQARRNHRAARKAVRNQQFAESALHTSPQRPYSCIHCKIHHAGKRNDDQQSGLAERSAGQGNGLGRPPCQANVFLTHFYSTFRNYLRAVGSL